MTDNPWKKRKSGRKEFIPPSRALLAEADGNKGTATWAYYGSGQWKCISASKFLAWMRGLCDRELARRILFDRGCSWHWIEPNTAKVLAPPF